MSVVSIFSASFCHAEELAQGVASGLGCTLLRDEDLIGRVAREGDLDGHTLRRAIYGRTSIFNPFSHERERAVTSLRLGMAHILAEEDLVYLGLCAQLIPEEISHVLAVCLVAEARHRAERAARELGLSEKEARTRIHRDDEAAIRWMEYLRRGDPWDPKHYDIFLPMDRTSVGEAVGLIVSNASSDALKPTQASRQAAAGFLLTARVEASLVAEGHNSRDLLITAQDGEVTIGVNKKVLRLAKLAGELKKLALLVDGVKDVQVVPGPGYYQADVYRQADFKLPSKVLLVDDEREFVQTLSERLMLREIGSAVVHDGEEALRLVAEDEPEVMVLDLKMPGIDGLEVLRRIKRDYPKVQVIILTGHGSDRDREACLQMGAFAYLRKPVDIDKLSEVMREAYQEARSQQD